MSNTILIIGQSGSGKSTAIRTLNPKSTFIINVLDKQLPFKRYKKNYIHIHGWDDKSGNYFASDDWQRIIKCIRMVNNERHDIDVIILDDFQYVLGNEFMRRAAEKGYDRFTDIAQHAWLIIRELTSTRASLCSFVLSHSDVDQNGQYKCKTIGKMLDDKITLEGMFTIILHSLATDGDFKFLTQNDGTHIAKSPLGMFSERLVDNDLFMVIEKMKLYEREE